eukprot:5477775-Pyramimonas_sp.AAC.1
MSGAQTAEMMAHRASVSVATARPLSGARPWVVDVSETIEGSSPASGRHSASCVVAACKEIQRRRLGLADQLGAACDSMRDGRAVVRLERREGFVAMPAAHAAHLGIVCGRGGRARAARAQRENKRRPMRIKIS